MAPRQPRNIPYATPHKTQPTTDHFARLMMRPGYLSRSWAMFKTSWHVLRQDRELLWLTVINLAVGFAFALAAGAIVLVAGILTPASSIADDSWWEVPPTAILVLAGLLFIVGVTLANTFFHGAIVHGALERLSGGDPTVSSALAGARSRFGKLMLWGLTALTIGLVLSFIQHALERIRFVGWILSSLVDLAWAVFKFLVLPIIIVENQGPFASLNRSKDLLKSTWGDNLLINISLNFVGVLLAIPGVIVIVLAAATGFVPVIVVGAILGGLYLVAAMLFVSALNSVLQSVLYHYAVKGEVPTGFDGQDLSAAFTPKSERGLGRGF